MSALKTDARLTDGLAVAKEIQDQGLGLAQKSPIANQNQAAASPASSNLNGNTYQQRPQGTPQGYNNGASAPQQQQQRAAPQGVSLRPQQNGPPPQQAAPVVNPQFSHQQHAAAASQINQRNAQQQQYAQAQSQAQGSSNGQRRTLDPTIQQQQQQQQQQQRVPPPNQQRAPITPQKQTAAPGAAAIQQQRENTPQKQQQQNPSRQQNIPQSQQVQPQRTPQQQQQAPQQQQQRQPEPATNSTPLKQNGNGPVSNGTASSSSTAVGTVPSKPEKIVKRRLRKKESKPKAYDKLAWLLGHIVTLVGTVVYSAYYFTYRSHQSFVAHLVYRVSFLGVIISYFVSLLNAFGSIPPSYFTLLTTENFQYLILAVVWFFNRSSFFKIFPYFLISILQLSSFFKIKPVLKLAGSFEKAIVYNELLLFVLLFVDTLLLRGTSGYALVIFGLFYSMKIVFNDETKGLVYSVVIKFDGVMSKQKNPKVQDLWHDIKAFLIKKKEEANSYSFHVKPE